VIWDFLHFASIFNAHMCHFYTTNYSIAYVFLWSIVDDH
jgi:hypothetical protein